MLIVPKPKLLIANWKLNHTQKSALDFINQIKTSPFFGPLKIAIAPVAPMLDFMGRHMSLPNVFLAAQNVFYETKGAFTGEWSAEHLAELGVKYCIVGHSERRRLFYETNEDVAKKTTACLMANIIPVICVGESLNERAENKTFKVIEEQILAITELNNGTAGPLVFAYEPLWAIGTGKNANLAQIEEVFRFMQKLLKAKLGNRVVDILYGGSVTPENIKEIVSLSIVDGALIGGASLQASSFLSMVEKFHTA